MTRNPNIFKNLYLGGSLTENRMAIHSNTRRDEVCRLVSSRRFDADGSTRMAHSVSHLLREIPESLLEMHWARRNAKETCIRIILGVTKVSAVVLERAIGDVLPRVCLHQTKFDQ